MYKGLGVEALNEEGRGIVAKFLTITTSNHSLYTLTSSFYILIYLDELNPERASVIFSIGFLFRAIMDYPTGALSDWLGQKIVYLMATLSFAAAFLLLSIANTYYHFFTAHMFMSFAFAQNSGTMETWFDNNYKHSIGDLDPNRRIYSEFLMKARTITDAVSSTMLIVGGFLASFSNRERVLQLQGFGFLILSLFVLIFLDSYKPSEGKVRVGYFDQLVDGFRVVFKERSLFLIVIGMTLYQATLVIFGDLVMFSVYYGYTGSDSGAGIFRYIVWAFGTISSWLFAKRISKLNRYEWTTRLHWYHTLLFYPSLALFLYLFPIENKLIVHAAIIGGSLIFITHMLRLFIGILLQGTFLDLVPDKNRNSLYSLTPTLMFLCAAVLIPIGGKLIVLYGEYMVLAFLMIFGLMSSIFISLGFHYFNLSRQKNLEVE